MSVVKKTEFNAEGVSGLDWAVVKYFSLNKYFLESQAGREEDQDQGEVRRSLAWKTVFLRMNLVSLPKYFSDFC